MAQPPDDYAKNQRRIRSLQPKVSSDEAHARARRALAKNAAAERAEATPKKARDKGGGSSAGPRGTDA